MRGHGNAGWVVLAVASMLAAIFVGAVARAAEACPTQPYEYQATAGGGWVGSVVSAVMPHAQFCADEWNADRNACSLTGSTTRTWVITGCTEAYPTSTCSYQGNHATLAPIFRTRDFATNRRDTVDCPPDPCAYLSGLPAEGGGSGSWADADLCRTDSGMACKVERSGAGINFGGGWFGGITFTGASCGTTGDEVEVQEDPPDCVTGPKGQICLSKQDQNCGIFNGEQVCLDKVPDNSCVILGNGGALCVGGGGPVDEEGEQLAADMVVEQVSAGVGQDVNYYGPDSVASSSQPVLGVASSSGTGNSVGKPPEASEPGEGFGAGPDGDDWDPEGGMAGALAAVEGSTWFALFGSIASAFAGSATCPEVTMNIEFLSASFDLFEAACGYMSPHYSLWTTIMQIAWGLLALRIFFGSKD